MIKKRLGDDFASKLSDNLQVKVTEVAKKDARGGKRKPRENRGEKGDKPERKPKGEQTEAKAEEKPQEEGAKPQQEAPKREGRRRGNREGQ